MPKRKIKKIRLARTKLAGPGALTKGETKKIKTAVRAIKKTRGKKKKK